MLLNYLKIAWRNLWNNRTLSAVSVFGLAMGLAATLLIALYVAHEYSYDRYHQWGNRIVKVELNHKDNEGEYSIPWMSYRFGEAIKNACPEVEDYARIKDKAFGSKLVQSDIHHKYFEPNFLFADAGVLRLFSFQFLKGNPKTVLTRPSTVLLTESTARKYFGQADPLGKTITYDKKHVFEVVGVLRDLPLNSSVQFDFLAQLDSYRAIERANYLSFMSEREANAQLESVGATGGYDTYFLLNRAASVERVEKKIPSLLTDRQQVKSTVDKYNLYPLFDLHFAVHSQAAQRNVVIFSTIAVLVLLLALINYISLATARSTIRAKEVSVRKTVGAARKSLITQFYLESALHVTLAYGLAVLLFTTLQPIFYETLDIKIDQSFLSSRFFWLPAAGFYLLSIFLSGSYPALLLSRFSPAHIMRGKFHVIGSAAYVRKGLTVFQLTISVALLISSLFIKNQLDLFLNKDVGINRERIVTVHLDYEDGLDKHYKAIRDELSQIKDVTAVTASSLLMYDNYMNSWNLKRLSSTKKVSVSNFAVDQQFINTMNLRWAIPPRKDQGFATTNQIVINEAAAEQLGINISNYEQVLDLGDGMTKNLVGVIEDFNYQSLARDIRPMSLFIANDTTFRDYLYIKLAKNAPVLETLAAIQRVYDRYKTEKPFDYRFLDETYRNMYKVEVSTGRIIFAFTTFAMVIAGLGLFGLAAFTAEQRTREVGIRKVLGASVASIVALLSKDFLKLVLVAILLATPIAWYAMNQWLQDFAYKIDIEWWVFALAGLLATTVAVLTVSFQSVKAALMNPVKSLRTE